MSSVHEKWAALKSERLANIAKMVDASDPGAFMVLRASTVRWLCLSSVSATAMLNVMAKDLSDSKSAAARSDSEAKRCRDKFATLKAAADKEHKIYRTARGLRSALRGVIANMPKCKCKEPACRTCTCLRVAGEALEAWNNLRDECNPRKKDDGNASE